MVINRLFIIGILTGLIIGGSVAGLSSYYYYNSYPMSPDGASKILCNTPSAQVNVDMMSPHTYVPQLDKTLVNGQKLNATIGFDFNITYGGFLKVSITATGTPSQSGFVSAIIKWCSRGLDYFQAQSAPPGSAVLWPVLPTTDAHMSIVNELGGNATLSVTINYLY